MVSQVELDMVDLQAKFVILEKKYIGRGKSLNKLWEKGEELKKEIAELKKYCGRLTYQMSVLHLENTIIVPSATGLIDVQSKQFLVKDIVRQMINESGYNLEFKVLQIKYPTKLKELRKTIKKK